MVKNTGTKAERIVKKDGERQHPKVSRSSSVREYIGRTANRIRAFAERIHPYNRAACKRHAKPFSAKPFTLLKSSSVGRNGPSLVNLANLQRQAGDMLLPLAVRDSISRNLSGGSWQARNIHNTLTDERVRYLNRFDGIIIGGGGLFLRDSNSNNLSGWQWPYLPDMLRRIQAPMFVFAVGYNRFHGQPEFAPIFSESLRALADKVGFLGLRNNGSIRAVSEYLPQELISKLRFQPCPTTLLGEIYPDLPQRIDVRKKNNVSGPTVGINCAFDRPMYRFGSIADEEKALRKVARAAKTLSKDVTIVYVIHSRTDSRFIPYLDEYNVPYKKVKLHGATPGEIIRFYIGIDLMVGMRGHSQLIPFGVNTPILSLISHPKMRYFLEDIQREEWGIDIGDESLSDWIVESTLKIVSEEEDSVRSVMAKKRREFWTLTQKNIIDIRDTVNS